MPTKEKEQKLQLNLQNWSYRDFLKFQQYSSSDPRKAYALAQNVISTWTYDIPITGEDALSRLPIEDAGLVLRTIGQTLERYFEEMDVSEVKVDFRRAKWNSLHIFEFQEALPAFDYTKIVKCIHEAATLEDVDPKATLPMLEGAMMVKAITERYGKHMSGKV